MASGRCSSLDELPERALAVVGEARRAVMTSLSAAGRPHSVPVCFAVSDGHVLTAIDQKPKRTARPARLRNLERDPIVTVLFDRWSEDWERLGWVMVQGAATLEEPGRANDALVARYPQYEADPPEGPVIRITPKIVLWWTWSE